MNRHSLPQPSAHCRRSVGVSSCSPTSISSTESSSSFKLPSLDDILADLAPEPYSLANFAEFLTQNHCLEVLEFALDVAKYGRWYHGWDHSSPSCKTAHALRTQWDHIIDTYIRVNAPKEINVPCNVRDELLQASWTQPILPSRLNASLDLAKDLMKENVYLRFIATAKTADKYNVATHTKQRTYSIHSHSDTSLPAAHHQKLARKRASVSGPPKHQRSAAHLHESHTPQKQKLWKSGFKWFKNNNN